MQRLMRPGRRVAIVAAMAVGLLVGSGATSAMAHDPLSYYSRDANVHTSAGRWPVSYSQFSVFGSTQSGWPSTLYARMPDAINSWNTWRAAPGQPSFLWRGTTGDTGDFDNPCNSTYNGIYWRNLNGYGQGSATLGLTRNCSTGLGLDARTHRGGVALNSTLTWHDGTGTGPTNSYDAWGVLTHELGHLTGWSGHFANAETCDNTSSTNTMCTFLDIQPNQYLWWRSLDAHDIHTWRAAYGY